MSIERRRNTEKRSVRTLIAIAAPPLWNYRGLGGRPSRGGLSLACTAEAAWHIKVLSDLVILFPLISIDIKVFQTFGQDAQAAPILAILLILEILLQTRRRHGEGQAPALRKKRALVPVRDRRDLHANVVCARNKAAPTLRKRC